MNKRITRELHISALSGTADRLLAVLGFSRQRVSMKYTRTVAGGHQHIDMIYTVPNRPDDSSVCHIQPIVSVELDNVNAVALEMVNGDETLLDTPKETTLATPLGFLGPERCFRDWRPLSDEDYKNRIVEVTRYVENHAVPFLDYYQNAEALVGGYEEGDDRLLIGPPLVIRVAAAAVCCSQHDMARQFVESAFKKAGPRRRYACIFQYLGKLERGVD